jgi:phosphatidylserine/phosphatidylglycerophosphate/cardiolipin synthase-like enzyme
MSQCETCPSSPHVRLLTERMVEHFLARLFLRDPPLRSLTLVAPFVNTMQDCRYPLADLSAKIRAQHIPTYFVTREPEEPWQEEAVALLAKNEWIEIRFNESLHAKVFVASAVQESESFAVFGSGNLTGAAINSNLEVGMLLLAQGAGRKLVDELYYWSTNNLRVLPESRIYKPIHTTRK